MINSFALRLVIFFALGWVWGKIAAAAGLGLVANLAVMMLIIFPPIYILITPYAWQWFKKKIGHESEPE